MGELCRPREARQPRGHLGPQQVPRDPLRQRHVHLRILLEALEVGQAHRLQGGHRGIPNGGRRGAGGHT